MRLKIRNYIYVVIGLGVFAAIVWSLWLLWSKAWNSLTTLNPTIAAGIVAAISAVAVSVLSVIVSKFFDQRIAVLKEHRDKKIPVYEELLDILFRSTYGDRLGDANWSPEEQLKKMVGFTQKVIIWGSDEVIKAYFQFRTIVLNASDLSAVALAVESVLFAIRRDLGHKNQGLTSGMLLGTFINDLHKLAKK